jgi:hypothetical protein
LSDSAIIELTGGPLFSGKRFNPTLLSFRARRSWRVHRQSIAFAISLQLFLFLGSFSFFFELQLSSFSRRYQFIEPPFSFKKLPI